MLQVALLVLALASPVPPQATPSYHSTERHEQTGDSQNHSKLLAPERQDQPQAKQAERTVATQADYKQQERMAKATERQAQATVAMAVIALLTGAVVVYYAVQARAQAKAMKKSTEISEKLLNQDRPWITVKPLDLVNWTDGKWTGELPLTVGLDWEIHNVGRTPVWLVEVRASLQEMRVDRLNGTPDYGLEPLFGFKERPIGPGQFTAGDTFSVTIDNPQQHLDLSFGKRGIFVFGQITYRGAHGGSHVIRFCFMMFSLFPRIGDQKKPTEWATAGGELWNEYT
ncbi:MAG TPA: hypothetical protein VMT19_02775 [Thermoanaerobaculaceae bacterium]|nr:hypothetical protein [Thermoanaerobaculaceae bacterium]